MKDYKKLASERKTGILYKLRELQKAIDVNREKLQKQYAVQASALAGGDASSFSTAENTIKFIKATLERQEREAEELQKTAAAVLTPDEYLEAYRAINAIISDEDRKMKDKARRLWYQLKATVKEGRETMEGEKKYLEELLSMTQEPRPRVSVSVGGDTLSRWINQAETGLYCSNVFE